MNLAFQNAECGMVLADGHHEERASAGIAGALRCYTGGGGGAPQPESLYSQTKGSLDAQVDTAPALYQAESKFQPLYQGLQSQGIEDYLFGSKGGTTQQNVVSNVNGFRNSQTGEFVEGQTAPQWFASPFAGQNGTPPAINPWSPYVEQKNTSQDVTTPATPGFLDIMSRVQPRVDQAQQASLSGQRAADIADVGKLGPGATAAFKAANPQQAALLDQMNQSTLQGLQAGSSLDPDLAETLRQQVRAGQAARGLGNGSGDAGLEAYYTAQQGNNLRQQRFQNATSMVGVNAASTLDPFQAILGRPSSTMGLANNYGSTALQSLGNAKPLLFDPMNQYASNAYDTQLNAQTSAYNAQRNNSAATTGALVGGGAKIAASLLPLLLA